MPPLGVDPTPWEVLGVAEGSSPAVVRTAWRRAVRMYHPDHAGGGDLARFLAVNDAYRTLEADFAPLRGTHPVEVAEMATDSPVFAEGESDPFDFLSGPPSPTDLSDSSEPRPDGLTDSDDDLPAPITTQPIVDADEAFDAAIDAALGTAPGSRSRRRRTPSRPQPQHEETHSPAPSVVRPDPPGDDSSQAANDDEAGPRWSISSGLRPNFETPDVSPPVLVAGSGGVAFVALRLLLQAFVPTAADVPVLVLVVIGLVVAAVCWSVASRLSGEEDLRSRIGVTSILVAIFCAVDILLLIAVPILLVGAVAFAATRQRGSRG